MRRLLVPIGRLGMPYPEIAPSVANASLEEFRVVDVRAAHEFNGPLGHLGNAELVPLPTLTNRAAALSDRRALLFVCRSGKRSGAACETLQALGVNHVVNLAGGMIAWNEAELPVDRTKVASLGALINQIIAWAAQVGPMTAEALELVVRERCEQYQVTIETPNELAVEEFMHFVESSLAPLALPDFDLSFAAFRRSLAAF